MVVLGNDITYNDIDLEHGDPSFKDSSS